MSSVAVRVILIGMSCASLAGLCGCREVAPALGSSGSPSRDEEYNPDVQAAGQLALIAELGATDDSERRKQANTKLAEVLEGLNAAPVPARLFPRVSQELTAHVPPRTDTTPDIPAAPEGFEAPDGGAPLRRSQVAGGELAAAIYAPAGRKRRAETPSGPVRLLIADGTKGGAKTLSRELVGDFTVGSVGLVIFDKGRGLVAWVAESGATDGGPDGRSWVFTIRAPDWEPKPVATDGQPGPLWLAGETVDGSAVYFRRQADHTLWRLTPATGELRKVTTGHYQGGLIPSPDGRMLAVLPVGTRFSMDPSKTPARGYAASVAQSSVRVIDTETGQIHTVTWRDGGYYLDQPVAWSADVPNRLYFTDAFNKLWQLDLKLDEASAERYRKEEAEMKKRGR